MKNVLRAVCGGLLSLASLNGVAADCNQDMTNRAIHLCARCHGENGKSPAAVFPSIAAQQPLYLEAQMKSYRDQTRIDPDPAAYMWGVSALLDDATIKGLAEYYAQQPPAPGKSGPAKLVAKGKQIYESGIPAKNVIPCAQCHGEKAEGASIFPRLAGQHAAYLTKQLQVFRTKLRPHGVVMSGEVKNMTRDEMEAVAAYLQSL